MAYGLRGHCYGSYYGKGLDPFMQRMCEWNKRAERNHLAATLRWADKLAQQGRKPLPKANWWHGDPYGKRPASWQAWSGRIAKKNKPLAFVAVVDHIDTMAALVKLGVDPGDIEVRK